MCQQRAAPGRLTEDGPAAGAGAAHLRALRGTGGLALLRARRQRRGAPAGPLQVRRREKRAEKILDQICIFST